MERQGDQMAWEGKPEKGAVPAWYSSVLSELLTAHTMSRAKMYKKFWQTVQEE